MGAELGEKAFPKLSLPIACEMLLAKAVPWSVTPAPAMMPVRRKSRRVAFTRNTSNGS